MGNNNNRFQQRKPNRPSTLKNAIQRCGSIDNYINTVNPMDMQKDAIRTFRDIVNGNLEIENEGQVFLTSQFINNAIIACNTKLQVNTVHYNACMAAINAGVYASKDIAYILENDMKGTQAYSIIYNNLVAIQQTGDLEYLTNMATQINQGRLRFNI